jgi:alpha-ketoglutarate-dependent taurine dioxygenase
MSYSLVPYTGPIGAEIRGLNCGADISELTLSSLYADWVKYKVLILVDQRIDDAEQIAFTRRFGPLEEFPLLSARDQLHREIFRVSNVDSVTNERLPVNDNKVRYLRVTQAWHVDSSYRAVPSMGSVFRGIEVTREGGETWFADLEKVYEELPQDLRRIVDTGRAVHDFEVSRSFVGGLVPLTADEKLAVPPVTHPLVRVHPDSGRKSLFLSPVHTSHLVGVAIEESVSILEALEKFATKDEFVYRHRWWPNDLMLWDNRSTMHYAQPYNAAVMRRIMHRTTVAGQ